jgi:hypothetical protein
MVTVNIFLIGLIQFSRIVFAESNKIFIHQAYTYIYIYIGSQLRVLGMERKNYDA